MLFTPKNAVFHSQFIIHPYLVCVCLVVYILLRNVTLLAEGAENAIIFLIKS